ncbi:MAG: hypothetical protein AAFP26_14455, partial [Planctomycetota bacterium]
MLQQGRVMEHCTRGARRALLAQVLVPVLGSFGGAGGRLADRGALYVGAVFDGCARLCLRAVEENEECLGLFVRHGGMHAINAVLQQQHQDEARRRLCSRLMSAVLGRSAPLEARAAVNVYAVKPHAHRLLQQIVAARFRTGRKALSAQSSLDSSSSSSAAAHNSSLEGARSFFRGFSFSWHQAEKRRSAAAAVEDAALTTEPSPAESADSVYDRHVMGRDEAELFRAESRRFVRALLATIGGKPESSSSGSSRLSWASKRLQQRLTDSNDDSGEGSRNSETSGYRSTSDGEATPTPAAALHPSPAALRLPPDAERARWREMEDWWRAAAAAVCRCPTRRRSAIAYQLAEAGG